MPAERLTWQRVAAVIAVCVVGACLAAVGYFSRGIHPVPAEPAASPPDATTTTTTTSSPAPKSAGLGA